MNAKGYPTQQGLATGETDKVTAITLKDVTGNETSLGTNKTKEIELEFTESTGISGETPYYVLADGKYYEIIKNASGDYELATTETSAEIVTGGGTPKTYEVAVSSSNSDAVGVSYNSSTKKITITSGATTTESPITITISYEDEDGNAKFTPISLATSVSNAVTAADIVNQTFATTAAKTEFYQGFYGSVVTNYGKTIDTSLNDQWKIFYAGTMGDETEAHIYLIADSYVNYTSLPSKVVGEEPNTTTYSFKQGDTNWKAYFATYKSNVANINDGILQYYPFESNIAKLRINTTYATETQIKNLNYDFWRTKQYTGPNQVNMMALSSMLDTDLWNQFMDSRGKAKYAIGGPTLEMLIKSVNQSHGTTYAVQAFDVATDGASADGYKINSSTGKTKTDSSWVNYIESVVSGDTNNVYMSEYNNYNNASGYWIASPSGGATISMMFVSYSGSVNHSNYGNYSYGFRPLVCLNSNVELERQENGTYIIK